jgi:hypothetical protein
MSDELKRREQAIEDAYFQKRDAEALARLAAKKNEGTRNSPITGKPMAQRAIHGVVIDQCEDSGGIWLDAGELEQIISALNSQQEGALSRFFSAVLDKK